MTLGDAPKYDKKMLRTQADADAAFISNALLTSAASPMSVSNTYGVSSFLNS